MSSSSTNRMLVAVRNRRTSGRRRMATREPRSGGDDIRLRIAIRFFGSAWPDSHGCGRNHRTRSDAILARMTAPALDAEPACPGAAEALPDTPAGTLGALRAERRPFDEISREVDRKSTRLNSSH